MTDKSSLTAIMTCSAYPEQYDVLDQSRKTVGYMRMRWGEFYAQAYLPGGEEVVVYDASPDGFGSFDSDDERKKHVDAALEAIGLALAGAPRVPTQMTVQWVDYDALLGVAIGKLQEDDPRGELEGLKLSRGALTKGQPAMVETAFFKRILDIALS